LTIFSHYQLHDTTNPTTPEAMYSSVLVSPANRKLSCLLDTENPTTLEAMKLIVELYLRHSPFLAPQQIEFSPASSIPRI
jgi:hypothetical protein